MTSSESKEPEGSERSSTEHKKHCLTHPFGDPHADGKCCLCGITREELEKPEKPALMCTCGHFQQTHRPSTEGGCRGMACDCDGFKLAPDPQEPPLTPEEEEEAGDWRCANESGCYRQHTNDCEHGCRYAADELTREANEMACQDCLAGVHGPNAHREAPPQPDRRPPYLLAYSVHGHLYEVALPGDATVAALDGRLVITHQLGPVAGICQIAPITSEESA